MTNRMRWLLGAVISLVAIASLASQAARTTTVIPQVKFTRAFDMTKPVYIEVSIENGPSTVITLAPGVRKGTFVLEGVVPGRNYIIRAKASNDPRFAPDKTQVMMAFVRKNALLEATATVNINSLTTPLAEAVSLYCENTGYDLNDAVIETDLDFIVAATDHRAEAERLSTTPVSGTILNVNNVPVGAAAVASAGVVHSVSTATDASGNFTLAKVPLRCTQLGVTCAPRYLAAQSDAIALSQNTPLTGITIRLNPDPAAARIDIQEAARLMVDNASGKLVDYLAENTNSFTYSAGTTNYSRSEFIANIPGKYHEISWAETNYSQSHTIDGMTVNFNVSTWMTRDAGTYRRTSYRAAGKAVFEGALWRLASLTLTDASRLPAAPVFQVTSGDGFAALTWTPSSDSLVTGYNIYRTATNAAPAEDAVPVQTLGKNEAAFTDAGLSTGTYYYWMRTLESYDPGTGAITVAGPLSTGIGAQVFSSRTVVEQFMQYAVGRNQTGMESLLGASFQAFLPGSPTGMTKANFVAWIQQVFALDSPPPARQWRVESAYKDGTLLKVRAFQIGHRQVTTPERNSRLIEDESWEVQNVNGTPVITRLFLSAPKYFPIAPANVRCTNSMTVETDGHVDLAWDRPADPELKGYRVLRSESEDYYDSTATWLQPEGTYLPPEQTTFTEGPISVAGKSYFYWVIAYDNYDINTMTESNRNNNVQVGAPAEVREAAEAFLASSRDKDSAGVRAAVTDEDFQATLGTRVVRIDEYCLFTGFTLTSFNELRSFERRFTEDGEEYYRLTYGIVCSYDSNTLDTVVIEVYKVPARITDGVWKVKFATFVDLSGQS